MTVYRSDYELDTLVIGVQFPSRARNQSLLDMVYSVPGAHLASYSLVVGGLKLSGCETDSSSLSETNF
jgi:hypothetical protein